MRESLTPKSDLPGGYRIGFSAPFVEIIILCFYIKQNSPGDRPGLCVILLFVLLHPGRKGKD
jgi:hypothetical protein